jgi:hypothetical protein
MQHIGTKGDIKFYKDEKGRICFQIGDGEIERIKMKRGGMRYIKQVNGYKIKFDLGGVLGYCIFYNNLWLEDSFWTLTEAEDRARKLTYK